METQPGRILVVDDHKTNRLKMSFAVKKEGHEVETAENGLEAMEMLKARPFSAVSTSCPSFFTANDIFKRLVLWSSTTRMRPGSVSILVILT